MAKFGIGCEQVKRVLDSSGYSSVDVNVKAVMEQFGKSPALLTAYIANVIQATDLPDPLHSEPLF
ncbi:hypothetical protein ACEWFW_09865 [Bifidobacterium catenulatum subsp. kashiwanohense]|jgi:hypothetical protein|uniref:hypothetical protein n=1 Tax=Bifidobacterium TaxID=1678 RepID=UPI001F1045DF|nr:hypothetical protein [Bifidobacterium pseudocatenulatum]MCH4858317.1 hypothetical protein [Bifidobacterium pseudocatenulatum]DAI85996.1 MAG TPA: hypothetical protein [Caudoviricetes sp.]